MIWLYLKALHIISLVAWFAGLFYLPRLFVYHAMTTNHESVAQYKIMERKLYFGIMTPAAFVTILSGLVLYAHHKEAYWHFSWMNCKLIAVVLLIFFHLSCGYYLKQFKLNKNIHHHRFFRFYNEIPTVLLVFIVVMVIVRPF